MKEKFVIKICDLVGGATAFGNDEGRDVFQKLLSEIDARPASKVIGISLKGMTRTDASFPRESVVSLAKSRVGEKVFYLEEFVSHDLRDNWDYAAKAKGFSMIVFTDDAYELIGVELNSGSKELLDIVMKEKTTTTAKVASNLDISAQNASAKLKKLFSLGLILGAKQAAESGGVEFVYTAIRKF